MNYREANLSDLKGVIKVGINTWKTTYNGIISDDFLQGLSYKDKEQKWKQRLENPTHGAKIYVAETGQNKIVGFALATLEKYNPLIISVQPEKYVGELCAIYVLKEFQGKNIGIQLIKLVVEYFLKNTITSMIVWVLKKNPYQRFYEKMGGQYIGEQSIEIGGKKYIEKAYGWENIKSILSIQ
jgi:GNAT superfamily N-acetyltransferase